jgi:hypothetical protein
VLTSNRSEARIFWKLGKIVDGQQFKAMILPKHPHSIDSIAEI